MSATAPNLSNSTVIGDQAGGDIIHNYARPQSQITTLLKKLEEQIKNENNDSYQEFVQNLRYFVDNRDEADVIGLEAKLQKSCLNVSYKDALRKKEEFAKLLVRFQEFSSAQELFAILLAHINDVFEERICPVIEKLSADDINNIVDKYIIDKIFEDIGEGSHLIPISRLHIRGMIYWLADKCFVRWHRC